MWVNNFTIPHSFGAYNSDIRLYFRNPPIFWKSTYILRKRLHFEQAPIFYACANILGECQYFDNFLQWFCLILLLQIFVYIFSIYLCIFMCANIFGAIVLKPRFKIAVVIMIKWSIVIIINSVLTLQVLTASLPHDWEPCEIKVVFNHTWFASYLRLRAESHRVRVRLSGLINGRNQLKSWGFPQAPHYGPGLCGTLRIRSQNRNSLKGSVGDLGQSQTVSLPCPFKYDQKRKKPIFSTLFILQYSAQSHMERCKIKICRHFCKANLQLSYCSPRVCNLTFFITFLVSKTYKHVEGHTQDEIKWEEPS